MAELKTKENDGDVEAFLNSVENERKRKESFEILGMMKRLSGETPRMWGPSIIGFGNYHYKYASGREGDWFKVGFSPRKQNFSLYLMSGIHKYPQLLSKLGKHKTGKGCLYINKLDDVDLEVLQALIKGNLEYYDKK